MTRTKGLLGVFAILLVFLSPGRGNRGEAEKSLALVGARLITVSGPEYERGTLLIRRGIIEAVGRDIPVPKGAQRIALPGCTLLPGLIDSFTNLGTVEVASVSQDFDEAASPLTPQLRIIDSFNPANSFIGRARRSGVTAAVCAPGDGNLLTGQSALVRLCGSTVDSMLIKFPAAVHGTLGEGPKLRYGQKGIYPSTRMGEMALLRQTLLDAQRYAAGRAAAKRIPRDPKLEPLLPVLGRRIPLVLAADRMDDILAALRLADEFEIRVVINHGAEAYKLADRLAARKIPAIIGPLNDLGDRLEEQDFSPENAHRLSRAGVVFAFQTGAHHRAASLLDQAASAVALGLSPQEALRALTLYPARIFGVEKQLGSLEKGKAADLVVFEGDPLKRPSRVRMVIVQGRVVEDMEGGR